MHKITRYVLSTLTAFCLVNTLPAFAAENNQALVHVTGYAEREVVPDMAFITLGMETTGNQLEEARTENATAMNRLQNELLNLGINKENLKTIDYRIYPRKDKNGEKLISYTVTNHLKIKLKELGLLSKVFERAAVCGINSIDDVEFTCSDTSVLKAELVKAAVANGRLVAEAAATSAGAQLGGVKEIHVNGVFSGFNANRVQNLKLAKAASMDISPVMEQGTQKLSETVNLVFYIKD